MKQLSVKIGSFILVAWALTSCASYKQNIMFKIPDNETAHELAKEAERNYVIQKNDYLKLHVYTNSGERIIDPELRLMKDLPNMANVTRYEPTYLVNIQGLVKVPMLGEIKLEGLTIRKAEQLLQNEYAKYYKDPYVILEYTNKRVIVLGSPGGKVIPLLNENVTLAEIIALAEGIDNNAKAQNIRVLRGEEYTVVDFSTIDGYKKGNLIMQHGDIVYIEPIRRPVVEASRDYAALLSLVISITTLMVVLLGLN